MGYNDVMMMPVYERRYFINLLVKQHQKRVEYMEENETQKGSNAKGTRKTKVSGDALKNKMRSGEIPLN